MLVEKVNITDNCTLDCYVMKHSDELRRNRYKWQPESRPAMVVFPGGGYLTIADSENEPIVFAYLRAGYNVFVLNYSTNDASEYPTPLIEASLAIYHIRKNYEKYNINKNNVALCGFSAGAHLATLISARWQEELLWKKLNIPFGENKPNALIIGYPLVDIKKYDAGDKNRCAHFGAMINSEDKPVNALDYVSENMPPVFIWHTRDDPIVPSNQSLSLAIKCEEKGIPYELHIFYIGDHGLSTCDVLSLYGKYGLRDYPVNVKKWVELSINWLNNIFEYDEFDKKKYK